MPVTITELPLPFSDIANSVIDLAIWLVVFSVRRLLFRVYRITWSGLSWAMVSFTWSFLHLTFAPKNEWTLTKNSCLTFFMRRYPFSFLTILSPKIFIFSCFSDGTSFSLFSGFLSYSYLLFSSPYFSSFLLLFSWRCSCFLFFSLILSEFIFSVMFLFCWFMVLSKFLGYKLSKALYNNYRRDNYWYLIIIDTGYFEIGSTLCNITIGWGYFCVSKLFNYLGICMVFFSNIIYFFLKRWKRFPVCWFLKVVVSCSCSLTLKNYTLTNSCKAVS